MEEVFDPPEAKRESGTKIGTSIRKDAVFEQDLASSYRLWGGMKYEEDGHLLSQAKRDLSHLDYQACSAESNYVTELGSHAYSEDSLPLGREYHRQKPTSICSWGKPTALEAAPSIPDTLEHALGTLRTKTSTLSARPDYPASYRSTAPHMRKYPGVAEIDYGSDHSEHRNRRSDQFTAFSSHKDQSIEHSNEMVDYARGACYANEINYISHKWHFDYGGPSYGDEIPSLSSKRYYEASSHSNHGRYGPQTPLFSRRHDYGDEIPSLSPNWRCRDKIPLRSSHWRHDAEAHTPSRYQQVSSHGNGHSRQNFARINSSEEAKIITSKHNFSKHRMLNRVVNSSHHHRINVKDNHWRNSEDTGDQVHGPRANKLNHASVPSTMKDIMSPLIHRDQFNRSDFSVQYKKAKFFMIKSFSEDDIHKGIKYNVWASTPHGNNKLDAAYQEAQSLMKENGEKCPVFLFFSILCPFDNIKETEVINNHGSRFYRQAASVNTSGQFVGLAEMLGPVDFKKNMDFWKEDIWNGFFPIIWHIIKDIPNRLFKHIILENNDNRIVTFSRDTQEIGLPQGLQMLKIFKDHPQGTSILDDFDFYEEKDNVRRAQKRRNSESTHEAQFSDDLKSMESLEARMESFSLYENWESQNRRQIAAQLK